MARRPRQPADSIALAVGLCVSLTVHGVLLFFAPRSPPARRVPEPFAMELVEIPSGAPVSDPLPGSKPERRSSPPRRREAAPERRTAGAVGGADPGARAPAEVERGAPAGVLELLAPPPSAQPILRLSPSDMSRLSGAGPGRSAGPEGRDGAVEGESERAEHRVHAILNEDRSAYQALTPDAYWSPVRDRMAERFVPTWTVFDGGRGGPGARVSSLGAVLSGYLDTAGRYGRAETAGGENRAAPGTGFGRNEAKPLDDRNPFRRDLVVLVRVVQRLDGTLERAEVVKSCGYRDLDGIALAAARAAVEDGAAGATPTQGRRTIWAFTAHYEVIPPVPVIGCPLDAIFTADFDRCAWPLKRSATAKVELRGVD